MQGIRNTQDSRAFMAGTGGEVMAYSAQTMRAFHQAELGRFRREAQAAGIKPE